MANPYPSGEGETRDLSDAQGPNQAPKPIYDRAAAARRNNADPRSDMSITNTGNQDGATKLERSIHDVKDMPELKGVIAWGHGNGETDLKREVK